MYSNVITLIHYIQYNCFVSYSLNYNVFIIVIHPGLKLLPPFPMLEIMWMERYPIGPVMVLLVHHLISKCFIFFDLQTFFVW